MAFWPWSEEEEEEERWKEGKKEEQTAEVTDWFIPPWKRKLSFAERGETMDEGQTTHR